MSDSKQDTQARLVDGTQLEMGGDYEDDERVVFRAQFSDKFITYKMVAITLFFTLTIFMIPFLILLPFMYISIAANYRSKELIVTEKTLVYKQGFFGCCCVCWNSSSKHVPLEKVTDVTFLQGCLARQYGLATIQVQTAGQNGPNGMPELSITGIEDAHNFRKIVMSAKAKCMEATFGGYGSTVTAQMVGKKDDSAGYSGVNEEVMVSMRDSLLRMEGTLKNIERGLAARGGETPSH